VRNRLIDAQANFGKCCSAEGNPRMPFWTADLSTLIDEALVPGAAVAIIRNGKVDELAGYGIRGIESPAPVDEHTVFEAASLSKPIFAYLVLLLADQGKLALDAALSDYLPNYLAADPRSCRTRRGHFRPVRPITRDFLLPS
jgi:CubicO group peptidase (beta-lactamase class C family)